MTSKWFIVAHCHYHKFQNNFNHWLTTLRIWNLLDQILNFPFLINNFNHSGICLSRLSRPNGNFDKIQLIWKVPSKCSIEKQEIWHKILKSKGPNHNLIVLDFDKLSPFWSKITFTIEIGFRNLRIIRKWSKRWNSTI